MALRWGSWRGHKAQSPIFQHDACLLVINFVDIFILISIIEICLALSKLLFCDREPFRRLNASLACRNEIFSTVLILAGQKGYIHLLICSYKNKTIYNKNTNI